MEYFGREEAITTSRSQRIANYRSQVSREEAAYVFIESLDTGMSRDQLIVALAGVRARREELEAVLRLTESEDFKQLLVELDGAVSQARQIMGERAILIKQMFKKRAVSNDGKLDSLRGQQEQQVTAARTIEHKIKVICSELQADPEPYLRLNDIVVEKDNVRMAPIEKIRPMAVGDR